MGGNTYFRMDPARLRILLVDDEEDNLDALQELLALEGLAAEIALGGFSALDRFERGERFDLVLCDVGMPGMSGWQLAAEIERIAPGTAIWLVTAWANDIAANDPRRQLVRGVLAKPLDFEEVHQLVS